MASSEVRKEIEMLQAELDEVGRELGLRLGLLKEDILTTIKVAAIAGLSYFGFKFATKFLKIFLELVLNVKFMVTAAIVSCCLIVAWYHTLTQEQE